MFAEPDASNDLAPQLYDALYNHFAARVQRSSGFISNQLRSQIINASRNFVVQYLVSSVRGPVTHPPALLIAWATAA